MESVKNHKMIYKCRKCRHFLFSEKEACDTHGGQISFENESRTCAKPNVCYLREDVLPSWTITQVDNGNWMKGKLFCPTCNSRIGSFDFVSGNKCDCGLCVLPALHVVENKLDREFKPTPGDYVQNMDSS